MTSNFFRSLMALVFFSAASVLAQAGAANSELPSAPSAAGDAVATSTGSKVGTINIEQAIFASNEGQRDFETLTKKLEPKQTELKKMSDELDSLKKQLNAQGNSMNEEARSTLVNSIGQKQKSLDRSVQDARDDAQAQQQDIAQKILQKMAPLIVKYANDHGYGVIIDTSNPWPNGPVLWAGQSVDITKAIVEAYNVESGVAAPVRPAAEKTPAATHPTTSKPGAK
ncbi:MAG TPA: OmpH family outer membrane protein [Terriglobales bacterium]|nr:OmpH family outer membrane protein [Terriglobales bacterium]